MDRLVLTVEDRRLDGPVEELVGMAAEELVQRVIAGDVDRQPAPPPPRPAPHLAQRGDRARERTPTTTAFQRPMSIPSSSASVVIAASSSAHQPALELAALLGRVAGPVGPARSRNFGRQVTIRATSSTALRNLMKRMVAPRAALADDLRQLAQRRGARPQRLVGQQQVPHRDLAPRARRAVAVHQRDVLQPRRAARPTRPGWRSSRWRAGSAARCHRRWRSRRQRRPSSTLATCSRTRRGEHAPRRRRRTTRSKKSPHWRWWGRIPMCSMSGLVRMRFARRRIWRRCSPGVSPS